MSEGHGEEVAPSLIVVTDPAKVEEQEGDGRNSIEEPAKVMRIGSMIRQLLEEIRHAPLDEASRGRLKEIYDLSVKELGATVSPDLSEELERLIIPLDAGVPSDAELRVAHASLVGWLEGLFNGIQATLFAQQVARSQLEQARARQLGAGEPGHHSPGTYL